MALSTAVLIAVMIKSAYLSRSLVDISPEKSAEPSASSSVDSNTSRSVWSAYSAVAMFIEALNLQTLLCTVQIFKQKASIHIRLGANGLVNFHYLLSPNIKQDGTQ